MFKYRFILILVAFLWKAESNAQLTYETLRVVYDTPWVYKNLKLIPVRFKPTGTAAPLPMDPKLISLDEAMQRKLVKVREIRYEQGSDLNLLEVVNTSKHPVLVNSGEMISGGKQDRMVSETKLLLPGKQKQYLKVFCIEKGRWDKKPKPFRHRGRAGGELRKTMDKTNRQSRIWKDIDMTISGEKEKSATSAFLKVFNDSMRTDTGYINFFTRKYRQSDSMYAGFIAITGKSIISCELYPTAELLQTSYRSILNTFVFSAITNGDKPTMTNAAVNTFTDKFLVDEITQKKYLLKNGKIHFHNKKIIHLTAYDE